MELKFLRDYAQVLNLFLTIALFFLGYLLQSKTRRITSLMAWKNYRDEVRGYAEKVIEVMSSIEGLCEANPQILKQDFWDRRNDLISRLSSLRDYGKLLIPNLTPQQYGQEKSAAYQGFRQRALDCLAGAFSIAVAIDFRQPANNKEKSPITFPIPEECHQHRKLWEGLSKLPNQAPPEGPPDENGKRSGWSCKAGIVEAKRQFVSEIQMLIDPRMWIDEIAVLVPKKDA